METSTLFALYTNVCPTNDSLAHLSAFCRSLFLLLRPSLPLRLLLQVEGVDFDDAVTSAKEAWANELARVAVVDAGSAYSSTQAEDYRTVFYSSMYRASKYPRDLAETDATTGELVHWSPYTGQVM